jgi:4-amino-4-deoxy-L-arabinose transferase-like glycosyltransferase
MAAGALTKGPVAIAIPLIVVIPYALATGHPLRRLFSLPALGAFALVGLPWFIAVTARMPEFPHYAFVHETFERFTTPRFHRTAPLWYYLPVIPAAAFPWIVPACARLAAWRATWATRRDPASAESVLLAAWILAPLVLFTLNHSKLPQYVLPLMPAFALAAARTLTTGSRTAWRPYIALATVLGVLLVAFPRGLLDTVPLTAAERGAIPPAALALGIVLLVSAACAAIAAARRSLGLAAFGYASVVIALPFVTAPLMAAVGDDRSAARLSAAIRGANGRGGSEVLGVAAYPPSLPFYLGGTIAVATARAEELTSNYIASYHDRLRTLPHSPLRPADSWTIALELCSAPTVFVARSADSAVRTRLAKLPLLVDDGRYAAYGPCHRRG